MASCWSHRPGAAAGSDTSWLSPHRWGPRPSRARGEPRWQPGCPGGALQAWRSVWRRRPAAAGLWVVWPVCNGSLARSWSAGSSPSAHGRGPAGGPGRRRAPEPGPEAAVGTWSAIPRTKASTTREGTAAWGRARPLERGEGGGAGGAAGRRPRPSGLRWRRRRRARRTLPRAPSPGPRGSRPRSPRPPPSQTPASSRPGSPGNH